MSSPTTRVAAAVLTAGALVLSLNSLSSPSAAVPNFAQAPATELDTQAGGTTLRARPFGNSILASTPEYYTVKVPRSGNYRVSMTGLITYDTTPAQVQCLVVDLQKILSNDLSGYYLASFSDSDAAFDNGLNETIDVDLRKTRRILLACSSNVDIEVLKPISITFKRNGDFTKLPTKVYVPPVRMSEDLLDGLR